MNRREKMQDAEIYDNVEQKDVQLTTFGAKLAECNKNISELDVNASKSLEHAKPD